MHVVVEVDGMRCEVDAKRMRSGCEADAKWIRRGFEADAKRIRSGCEVDAKRMREMPGGATERTSLCR